MLRIVHVAAVHHIEVLVRGAAAHVEGRRKVRERQDAGQGLQRAQQVGLGYLGNLADLPMGELNFGNRLFEELLRGLHGVGPHHGLGHLQRFHLQGDIQLLVFPGDDSERLFEGLVPDIGADQQMFPGRDLGNNVVPAHIGDPAQPEILQEDRGTDQALAVGRIVHKTAHRAGRLVLGAQHSGNQGAQHQPGQ